MKRNEGDPFAYSMTDLMAGVAVTFLVIAAIFMVQVSSITKARVDEAAKSKQKLELLEKQDTKSKDIIAKLVGLIKNEEGITYTYDEGKDPYTIEIMFSNTFFFFANGKCDLGREGGLVSRDSVIRRIITDVCENKDQLDAINLEGHTDNRDFRGGGCGAESEFGAIKDIGFRNNVGLSARRAEAVFFRLREQLADARIPGTDEGLVKDCLDKRFVVSGRGPAEATVSADASDDDRAKDRKVVLRVRVCAGLSKNCGGQGLGDASQ